MVSTHFQSKNVALHNQAAAAPFAAGDALGSAQACAAVFEAGAWYGSTLVLADSHTIDPNKWESRFGRYHVSQLGLGA